jgi:hypothetical protein
MSALTTTQKGAAWPSTYREGVSFSPSRDGSYGKLVANVTRHHGCRKDLFKLLLAIGKTGLVREYLFAEMLEELDATS